MLSPNIMIGEELIDGTLVAEKMQQDINFLSDRLAHLNQQRSPNPKIIKVYQDMLDSRNAVLGWLNDQQRAG